MTRKPLKLAVRTAKKTRDAARGALLWGYEQRLAREVKAHARLPRHLGLILDGNRRFARAAGVERELGYEFGIDKAHEVLQWCLELGIPAVTIWVLSTDNIARDPDEVRHLMGLFDREARNLARDPRIHANRVRVRAIGQHHGFPGNVLEALGELEAKTAGYDGMLLNIAVGYGGREEIVDAVKQHLAEQAAAGRTLEDVTEALKPEHVSAHLYTAGMPDPDFIIRTSGEIRLSGFMLWQSVYSEFYFCDVYWPGFRRVDFLRALRDFQGRERRFGK
ncbi:undecaprenyl pyrophosphate synthase [Deinococcus aerius]|uniref:Isoprenyl transferase n=1 Tax=Deinococcus aerius TaxID=200253 RepID=A0A2I9CV91_9DEIO|nr:isoprenyl transferase [Deinococcus aerius]GBF05812.1 undecaprenyl pyrophosphate synthase [Deinococcus aerius]